MKIYAIYGMSQPAENGTDKSCIKQETESGAIICTKHNSFWDYKYENECQLAITVKNEGYTPD